MNMLTANHLPPTFTNFDIREVFPYLSAFREQYLVLTIPVSALLDEQAQLVDDLLMLAFSGIRLILVPDYEDFLQAQSGQWELSRHPDNGQWVIPESVWSIMASTLSLRHLQIQAALSRKIRRQDLHRQSADIHAGVYVHSRARGIYSGVDLGNHGAVRSVDKTLIANHLEHGGIALISALAPSATGYLYWIPAEQLSTSICLSMKAMKWLRLVSGDLNDYLPANWLAQLKGELGVTFKAAPSSRKGLPAEVTTSAIRTLIHNTSDDTNSNNTSSIILGFWNLACQVADSGKSRVHLIRCDGALHQNNLLTELFTHHGSGIMLCPSTLESIRPASLEDVGGIVALIAPLEQDGTMAPRSREEIELAIQYFWVAEHDARLIACAALIPITLPNKTNTATPNEAVELACMAVAPAEQHRGLGGELLETLLEHGEKKGVKEVFLLTARTHEWFAEYGFHEASPDELPLDRRKHYDNGRCSRVMKLSINSVIRQV